ncbi:1-phosphofructokinase [Pullulanibacillus camelliae]|uniref:Tagatose-6-phosphate kinase n=2 Tax=Pullulanibacillus camelliae TaxID=1707096 RepID=A0A8J2VKN1_9BACL|nr:1-phosphofructokinase [Pullulanibacillus camelliae]
MIYTVTLDPSMDYCTYIERLSSGKQHHAKSQSTVPNGEGIDVSRMLNRFNVESRVLGFIGGFTGDFIRVGLVSEGLSTDFVEIAGDTRINVKVIASDETEIIGVSPHITADDLEKLYGNLEQLTAGDTLVLAGRVPDALSTNVYQDIIQHLVSDEVKVIVDTLGQPLFDTLKEKPYLITINDKALADMFHTTLATTAEVVCYGRKLLQQGAQNIIVSLGANGALLLNETHGLKASISKETVLTTGTAMVSGFVAAEYMGKSLRDAFLYAVATDAAALFSDESCTWDEVETWLEDVESVDL